MGDDFMDLLKNGRLLYNLRKEKNLTQKQVADLLGISPKTVSKWETGHGFPDVSTISMLADILGVSEKTLLCGGIKQNIQEVGNIFRKCSGASYIFTALNMGYLNIKYN